MNTKQPVHIMVFGVASYVGDIIPQCNFLHIRGLHKEEVVLSCLKTIRLTTDFLRPAIQAEFSFSSQKISTTASPQISGCLTPNIAIPSIITCGETIKDELKARITAVFTNLNQEAVENACKRICCPLEAVLEAYIDFFE